MTFTDQFCGAGGSSQGVRNVPIKGLSVKLALNHWKLAIDTHQTNFPDTIHDCTDIQACDPRYYPTTDILITSPECTNHSLANGRKQVKQMLELFNTGRIDPAAERSRATMWDVPRFAEYHRYKAIIVENVVDARKWVMWDAWLMAMHALGYKHKCVYINSMHCLPTPQSRDRMYVVFWKKTQRDPNLEFTPKAYCNRCTKNVHSIQTWKNNKSKFGKYKAQYYYRCSDCSNIVEPYYYAAFNAIDWSDIGTKISDRNKPLSDNTMKRIQYGLDHYSEPTVITTRYSSGIDVIPTIPDDQSHGIFTPLIIKGEHMSAHESGYVRNSRDPLQTQTVRQSMSMVVPFIIELNRTGKARSAHKHLSTILANGNHHGITFPSIANNKGLSKSSPVFDSLKCITTKPYQGIVTSDSWNSFLDHYYGKTTQNHITEPLGTLTTRDRVNLISYKKPSIDDCYYRMLKPHEIQAGMAFDKDYVILGNSRDKVKQCGNAVTPPVMSWLVERVVKSLDHKS